MRFKKVERGVRAAAVRLTTAVLRRRPPQPAPDWGSGEHRVLFLRHDRVGDMILSTGVIRGIAASAPALVLDVLASPVNAPVLDGMAAVRRVLTARLRHPWSYPALVWRLRRARYHAVVDCMVTAPSITTLLLMLASGARHRIGVERPGIDGALTLAVPPRAGAEHIVEHLSALTAAFGLDPESAPWSPVIALAAAERTRAEEQWRGSGPADATGAPRGGVARVLVNVSAGRSFRRWPDERYALVLRHLRERVPGARLLVIGAPAEWERVRAIAAAGGGDAVATPGLRDALALVATAGFVFTPDTSLVHAASAFGTPVVAMYVRQTARLWGAYGVPWRAVSSDRRTLETLGTGPVLAAVDALLGEIALGAAVAAVPHGAAPADAGARTRAVSAGEGAPGRNFSPRSGVSTTGTAPPAA
jgi:ADP-heptose:LPS heptosyltransferase